MKAAFNKLISRKKKLKTLSTGPGLNQSMIDMIVSEARPEDSFHSQRHVRSPTSADAESLVQNLERNRDDLFSSPGLIRPKSNISSVLNVPKKRSIVEDLYEILQEHVITQLGDIMTSKKNKDQKINIPKVKLSDFQDYINNLKSVYNQYKKHNARRIKRTKEVQGTDVEGNLQKCYKVIPSQYFDEEFLFNFEYLTSDKEKVLRMQEDLGNFLDTVESNLYLQLSTRFQEFLDVILKLSQMEAQINNSLYTTRFFKNLNKELKVKCSSQVKKVLKLRHKKSNMAKVLEIVNIISAVRKTIPSLTELVEKNNLQGAITLIKTSEETYQNKLKGVKVVKRLNLDFKDARNLLEKLVTAKFEDKAVTYLTKTLGYTKKSQMQHLPDISIVEESFMNVSTFDGSVILDEEPSSGGNISLNWTIEAFNPDKQMEGLLVNTVLEYIKIRAFPMYRYREKVGEILNRFHKKFMTDMEDYVSTITVPQPGPNQDNMLFDLHIKFLLFYFNLFKRFVQTHFNLSHQILTRLLKYCNQAFYDPESGNSANHLGKEPLTEEAYIAINDTVEDIYSTIAIIFGNFNMKLTEIIRKQSVEWISIHQFAKLNAFFEEVTQFFKKDLNAQDKLTTWIVTDIEKLKISLLNNNENFDEKITIEPLLNLRVQCGKDYVSYFHKHNHDTIKHTLEQDAWTVSDIPYTYRIYFDLIFNGEGAHRKESVSDKPELDEEDIFKSARPDVNDLEVVRRLALGETPKLREFPNLPNEDNDKTEKSVFEIKKSELIVNKQRFKLNGSLLVLIKLTCDYYNVAYKFDQLRELTLTKMFDLLKFYNSFTKRLINNAEATMFGKVKKITAKILGLSIISLNLLLVTVTYLDQTIEKSMRNLKEGWLHAETENIKGEIKNHIYEIKLKICLILKNKLLEQCTDLRQLNWGHNQLKVNIPTKSSASILHNIRQMYKSIEDVLFREQLVDLFESIFGDLKNNYLPIFENLNIENKLAAKRVKEELEYFKEDLHHLHIFQEPELNFKEFDDRIKNLVQNKCVPLLGSDATKVEEPAIANGENAQLESENSPANHEEDPIEITQPNGGANGEIAHEEVQEAQEEPVVVVQEEENTQEVQEEPAAIVQEEENIQEEKPQEEEAVVQEEKPQEQEAIQEEEAAIQEEKPQEEEVVQEEKPQEEVVQEEEPKEEVQEEKPQEEEVVVEEKGEEENVEEGGENKEDEVREDL